MILRVWAMYSRSRLVLITLLLFFSVMVISTAVDYIILTTVTWKSIMTSETTQNDALGISFCASQLYSRKYVWGTIAVISQIAHGALLCTLVIIQFVRQSIQMYRSTQIWELNKYINLMVKQGIIYFFGAFLVYFLSLRLNITTEAARIIISILAFIPMFALTPRFIISVRKLYVRERREGFDTGFGLLTLSGGPGTAMVFADVEQNEIERDGEGGSDE